MTTLLLSSMIALAVAEPAELYEAPRSELRWAAPSRSGAPQALGVRTAEAVAPWTEGTSYSFTTLSADAPWFSKRLPPHLVVATRVKLAAVAAVTPAEDRGYVSPGNLQVEQWIGFTVGDRVRMTHAFFTGAFFPMGGSRATTAVFVHPNETMLSAGAYTGYYGYADLGRLDVAIEASVGLGQGPYVLLDLAQTHLSAHAFYEVIDGLPLVAGVVVTPWMSHVQLGARFRPAEHVDAGLSVNIPVRGGRGPDPESGDLQLIQPMVDLRVMR